MRILIQRVQFAKLSVDQQEVAKIGAGLLILAGFEAADTEEDMKWVSNKALSLRIFSDQEGKMNLSVQDIQGECLLVSQFTLHASTKKGNRPSFIRAAPPQLAKQLYDRWVSMMKELFPDSIAEGVFGGNMQIELLNDGPVTISIDSKNRE